MVKNTNLRICNLCYQKAYEESLDKQIEKINKKKLATIRCLESMIEYMESKEMYKAVDQSKIKIANATTTAQKETEAMPGILKKIYPSMWVLGEHNFENYISKT